jgi:acetyl esterase
LPPQGAHPYLATKLAGETHCAVFLVKYSLSPEVRFPVAVEECYSVTEYVSTPEHAKSLNVDPTRVAVGGDSAGGNLTISTTLLAKQRNLANKIKFQVLYYPSTAATCDTPSYHQFGEGHFLTSDITKFFGNNYFSGPEDLDNILAVPIKATTEDLTDLPPALCITGEADVLRDEGEAYAHKLLDANVPVTSYRVQGVLHGFMSVPPLHSQETLQVIDITTAQLRRVFAAEIHPPLPHVL